METATPTDVKAEEKDYKVLYEQALEDLQKVVAKKDELLSETKKAKQEKAEQLALAQKAEQEKAQRDGEFEKLWKTAEEQKAKLEQDLQNERNSYKQEKVQTQAMKIAVELADGNAQSAKLLSYFLKDRLTNVVNDNGSLDDNVIEAIKKEFKNNSEYAPLLSGSKASGGGAQGNTRGASNATREMTQKEIDSYSPADKVRLLNEGVKVIPNN